MKIWLIQFTSIFFHFTWGPYISYTSAMTEAQSNVLELTNGNWLFWENTHFEKCKAPANDILTPLPFVMSFNFPCLLKWLEPCSTVGMDGSWVHMSLCLWICAVSYLRRGSWINHKLDNPRTDSWEYTVHCFVCNSYTIIFNYCSMNIFLPLFFINLIFFLTCCQIFMSVRVQHASTLWPLSCVTNLATGIVLTRNSLLVYIFQTVWQSKKWMRFCEVLIVSSWGLLDYGTL